MAFYTDVSPFLYKMWDVTTIDDFISFFTVLASFLLFKYFLSSVLSTKSQHMQVQLQVLPISFFLFRLMHVTNFNLYLPSAVMACLQFIFISLLDDIAIKLTDFGFLSSNHHERRRQHHSRKQRPRVRFRFQVLCLSLLLAVANAFTMKWKTSFDSDHLSKRKMKRSHSRNCSMNS